MRPVNDLSAAKWRKSSYSGAGDEQGGGNCLEVADDIPRTTRVRDSKRPNGPTLAFPTPTWAAFVAYLR
ncbi:DUF397 domain-containing protein [Streptomyces sp. NPDC049555]|uniref:DUF397 domain-containing protein n=1 Tax=Streptomyces sp. NPDC049555 TaxID=3154930 RepID=UPI00342BA7CF